MRRLLCIGFMMFGCAGQNVDLDDEIVVSGEDISNVYAEGSRLLWTTRAHSAATLRGCDTRDCPGTVEVFDTALWEYPAVSLGGGRAYWLSKEALRTCPVTGCSGEPVDIIHGPVRDKWSSLVGDESHVCWSDFDASYCCPSSGCGAAPLRLDPPPALPAFATLIKDGYVYSRAQSMEHYSVQRAPLNDLAASTVIADHAWLFASNSTSLIVANEASLDRAMVCPFEGCAPNAPSLPIGLSAEGNSIPQFGADDRHLYWIEQEPAPPPSPAPPGPHATPSPYGPEVYVPGKSRLKRCALSGCSKPDSVLRQTDRVLQFALGSDDIYWIDWEPSGKGSRIRRAKK